MEKPNFADIIKLAGESTLYTLHSHTQFCDGKAEMEDFVQAAIEAGFSHYGFSPHSPVPFESPCNMKEESVPLYFAEFDRLSALYGNRIKLLKSMEIDYIDGTDYCADSRRVSDYGLDYIISSIHFIPTPNGEFVDIDGKENAFVEKMHRFFNDDIKYVVDTFFACSHHMIERGGFDIIGHFDKIVHNASYFSPGIEQTPYYQQRVSDLVDAIIQSGIAVEINTKAFSSAKRFYPAQWLWLRLLKAGVPIVVNSDAHYPSLINASRNEAYDIINKLIDSNL